jgi:hypothetical protein
MTLEEFRSRGFEVVGGIEEGGRYFIYNHHKLTVRFHNDPSYEGSRVVGFDVAEAAKKAITDSGGELVSSPKEVADKVDIVFATGMRTLVHGRT